MTSCISALIGCVHGRVREVAAGDAALAVRALLEIGLAQVGQPAALAPIDQRRETEWSNAEVVAKAHRKVRAFRAVELLDARTLRVEAIEGDDLVRRVAHLHFRAG